VLFTTELGTPVDPRNVLRANELAAQKAGVTSVGVHTLRHSAAVSWLESGVHIKAVADLLGHSSIPSPATSLAHQRRHGEDRAGRVERDCKCLVNARKCLVNARKCARAYRSQVATIDESFN
jgi:integrase